MCGPAGNDDAFARTQPAFDAIDRYLDLSRENLDDLVMIRMLVDRYAAARLHIHLGDRPHAARLVRSLHERRPLTCRCIEDGPAH